MPAISKSAIKRAISNVIEYGDTDIFAFPFENHLIRQHSDDFRTLLEEIAANPVEALNKTPPQFESALVPVSSNGYRWATQADPFWNCLILAATLTLSKEIEAQRRPIDEGTVHSYRIDLDGDSSLFLPQYGWRSFMQRSYVNANSSNYVTVTDISEFYTRIYHHRVENSLLHLTDSDIPKLIIKYLWFFSGGASYGIPIGGPASRILSELTLAQIDSLLASKRIRFCRFSDDYHLFTDTIEEAHVAIQLMSEKLIRNQGLSLQKSKTRIIPSNEYLTTFPNHLLESFSPSTDRERLFTLPLNYDPYSLTANEDYEELKSSLNSIDFLSLLDAELQKSQVHKFTAAKLVKGLKHLTPGVRKDAIKTVLGSIELLFPVLSQLLIVFDSIFDDLSEQEKISIVDKLVELSNDGSYLLQLDVHRTYALRILWKGKNHGVDSILQDWYSSGGPIVKRDVILAYAARGDWHKLSDIRSSGNFSSQWERRAFIATSYMLKDEGQHWRKSQHFNEFEEFVRNAVSNQDKAKIYRLFL